MELLEIFSLLVVLAAVFSCINHRFLRLPTTIGVMAIALVFSLGNTSPSRWRSRCQRGPSAVILSITYAVVVFSILVQGLTLPRVAGGVVER